MENFESVFRVFPDKPVELTPFLRPFSSSYLPPFLRTFTNSQERVRLERQQRRHGPNRHPSPKSSMVADDVSLPPPSHSPRSALRFHQREEEEAAAVNLDPFNPSRPSIAHLIILCSTCYCVQVLIMPQSYACYVERGDADYCSNGIARHVNDIPSDKPLQVVLVSPQIPGNTGCIARTCAASAVGLHLVEPLGYKVDDSKLKRAGLDYWPYVVVKIHASWADFRDYFRQQDGRKRLLAFTKRGTSIHSDFSYKRGDWLVFGSETCGLPPEALLDCSKEGMGGGTIRIPMVDTYVRCLNLSVSVGIALYEASRQLNYEQIQCPTEAEVESQRLFISEDIFG